MSDKCECSMAHSMVGDGCRYCQPQEYIDRLHEHMAEDENDWRDERARLVEALRECEEVLRYVAKKSGLTHSDAEGVADQARQLLQDIGEDV